MRRHAEYRSLHPAVILWLAVGWLGYAVLPWYTLDDGLFSFTWLAGGYPLDRDSAPALFHVLQGRKPWLTPLESSFSRRFFFGGGARTIPSLPTC